MGQSESDRLLTELRRLTPQIAKATDRRDGLLARRHELWARLRELGEAQVTAIAEASGVAQAQVSGYISKMRKRAGQ